MSQTNPHKTVSANSKGVIISFGDVNKHQFIAYNNTDVQKVQLYGNAKYQQFESPVFNKTQQKIYAEALYGLNVYSEMELQTISKRKKNRIKSHQKTVQSVLNIFKQEVIDIKMNSMLLKLFPHSKFIKAFCQESFYDETSTNTFSFKDLNITPVMIVNKLIECQLLPNNFFQLT
jgi:hypothetical protein